jgi:hypothetical protein
MITMIIMHLDSLKRVVVVFLVVVANAIVIGSLTIIIIMAYVFYDYRVIHIIFYYNIYISYNYINNFLSS